MGVLQRFYVCSSSLIVLVNFRELGQVRVVVLLDVRVGRRVPELDVLSVSVNLHFPLTPCFRFSLSARVWSPALPTLMPFALAMPSSSARTSPLLRGSFAPSRDASCADVRARRSLNKGLLRALAAACRAGLSLGENEIGVTGRS